MRQLERIDTANTLAMLETASEAMYRARALVCTALLISDSRDYDFEKSTFRQDGLHYQLESLKDLVTHYESLFDNAVNELLRNRKTGTVEVLPENCAQAVFSSTHPIP